MWKVPTSQEARQGLAGKTRPVRSLGDLSRSGTTNPRMIGKVVAMLRVMRLTHGNLSHCVRDSRLNLDDLMREPLHPLQR
jgi:hypothetical protein